MSEVPMPQELTDDLSLQRDIAREKRSLLRDAKDILMQTKDAYEYLTGVRDRDVYKTIGNFRRDLNKTEERGYRLANDLRVGSSGDDHERIVKLLGALDDFHDEMSITEAVDVLKKQITERSEKVKELSR